MKISTQATTTIPATLTRLFQEYEFEKLDTKLHANTIIERTLELGTWSELYWLFHHYGVQRIIDYLCQFGHRRLSKITFNYWCKLLSIEKFRTSPFSGIRDDVWRF